MKKLIATTLILLLIAISQPAFAMLKVLDPEVSSELRNIAIDHITANHGVDKDSVSIEDGWVRELFHIKVDIYMIEATLNKGNADEQKLQIPVRVDTKSVLSEADFALLVEEDAAQTPDEPIARVMSLDTAVTNEGEAAPETLEATDGAVQEPANPESVQAVPISADLAENPDNSNLFLIAGALLLTLGIAAALLIKRRKA